MNSKNTLILVISIMILLTISAYLFLQPYLLEHGEHNTEKIESHKLIEALEKFNGSSNYIAEKDEIIDNQTHTIKIIKNKNGTYVKLINPKLFYSIEYISNNNNSAVCFNFTNNVCANAQNVTAFTRSLIGIDDISFVNKYLPQIKILAENNALHIIEEKEYENKTCYTYTYSFGDLPLIKVQELGLPQNTPTTNIIYKSILCLNKIKIFEFSKNYEYNSIKHHESVILKNFNETLNNKIPSIPKTNLTKFRNEYYTWKQFSKEYNKITLTTNDLNSLAIQYSLPEICLNANTTSNSDACLAIYFDKTRNKEICHFIVNETMRNKCNEFDNGLMEIVENNSNTN